MDGIVFENINIVNAGGVSTKVSLYIDSGKIQQIGQDLVAIPDGVTRKSFSQDIFALPGFIDLHLHGAAGSDVMDATPNALETISTALLQHGTTSYLATTMTMDHAAISAALENIAVYMQKAQQPGAEVLGVHLEGPFLHPRAAGAQNAEHMQEPDYDLFCKWQSMSGAAIKLVTLAAEYDSANDFIAKCRNTGVIASIGHTDACAHKVQECVDAGANYATHLFNAMSGLHHRASGAAYPLLLSEKVTAELIADGLHISDWAAHLAWRLKQAERLVLVSDAMRARCLGAGEFELGGRKVTVSEDGKAVLEDGTLAGSVLDQLSAARWMRQTVGCDLQDVVRMCSVNPARLLGVADRKGAIAVGMDADIVLVDANLQWLGTVCRGESIWPI